MKAFIIEADSFQRQIFKSMMEKLCQYDIVAFDNVDDCIFEIAITDEPVIIFSDINLPHRSGITLIRKVQEFNNVLGFFTTSALPDHMLESLGMLIRQIGVKYTKVLKKPIKSEDLKQVLSNVEELIALPKAKNKHHKLTKEELLLAMYENSFVPYFQPQINIDTGEVKGFEILGRIVSDGTIKFPDTFIEPLLSHGLITDYTVVILEKAIRSLTTQGLDNFNISLNVDYHSLMEVDFSSKILKVLSDLNYSSHKLTIEITESASSLTPNVLANITELKLHSILISIDDFGIGGSGINELLNIPYSELKIDRSHVAMLKNSNKAQAVIKTLANLSADLNLTCIAEGVETIEQIDALRELNIKVVQGFFFSKAIPADELKKVIKNTFQLIA